MNLKVEPRYLIDIARKCYGLKDQVKDLLWELKDARLMAEYSKWIMRKRWREAEEFIIQNGTAAVYYANLVLKRTWPEAEQEIIKSAPIYDLTNYAVNLKKNRWREAEYRLVEESRSIIEYGYLAVQNSFLEPFKEVVLATQCPEKIFSFCRNFIHKRCDRSERIILQSPICSAHYAEDIIKGRWPEAEEIIQTDPNASIDYASNVIKKRWLPGEKAILTCVASISYYSKFVMKERWYEGEVELYKHDDQDYWKDYMKNFVGGLQGKKYFLETNPLLKDKP